jgi:lipopolysaccharide/colanic/teichoic acid biosynthesis glycosyltransferase
MWLLIWFAVGLILDFMFRIQNYILHRCFADIFTPNKSIFKRASALLTSSILYIAVWPCFIIAMIVLKLKEMDEEYEE